MSKAAAPQRWFTGWRAPAAPAASDPADLGTAFGLDMSLHELQQDPSPQAPARTQPRGWMQRLAAGRKPAA
jgi:hypothetical protein